MWSLITPNPRWPPNQSGSQMAYFYWTPNLGLYNILLAFWNLIEVQINNSVDAALAPFKDIGYRAKSKMAAI